MILSALPHNDTHNELFWKYKLPCEYLGVSVIKSNYLFFDTVDSIELDVKNFFKKGINTTVDWGNLHHGNFSCQYQKYIENYTKLVWLSKDYIINEGFNNPIGIHWNPDIQKWNIHPGGSRQKVLDLFGPNKIKCITFNTQGKKTKFKKIFNSKAEVEKFYNSTVFITVCADHGSLIPHVHFSQETLINNVQDSFEHIQSFFANTKINANFNLEDYNVTPAVDYKKEITVHADKGNELKALILLPSFDSYNKGGIKIECT